MSIGSIEYKGLLKIPDSYLPPNSCKEHMLRDFPRALPRVQQLAFIVVESQRIASDRLSRSPPGTIRLTEDEALAVAAYTFDLGFNSELEGEDNLYNQLNDCLRERNVQRMTLLKPYLSYFLRALTKFPAVQATVYRGVPADCLGVVREKYKVGTKVSWSAFTSTYTDIATAKQFAQGPGGVVFRINNVLNGRSLSPFCTIDCEVLLSPNSVFIVIAECLQDADGYIIVNMVEHRGEG